MFESKKINPDTVAFPPCSFSNGILVPLGDANIVFVSGQVAKDADNEVLFPNDAAEQARIVFSHIGEVLKDAGMTLDNVVEAQIFLTDMDDAPKVSAIRDRVFENNKPASTMVEVSRLAKPGWCVEIEVVAIKRNT